MQPLNEVQFSVLESFKCGNDSIIEELTYKTIPYERIKKNFGGFNYGEILLVDKIIPQYPSIYRCYNFRKALQNHYHETEQFIVEEKMDGYNVRIVCHSGEILCFTRGGFVCPYTTEIIEKYPEIREFLVKNPDKILCAEMIGENPYNTLSIRMYGPEPKLFIFDIMTLKDVTCKSRKRSFLISTHEKMAIFKQYQFNKVPVLGKFTPRQYKTLKSLILQLNEERKEGIVIKPLETSKKYIKYATPYADIEAITDHMTKSFECDTAHFRKRLFLIASYLLEFTNEKEIFSFLSEKLMTSLLEVLKENKKVEVYDLTITMENWIELEKLLSRTLKISVISDHKLENGKRRIRFEKYYKKTSDFIKGANSGRLFID